MTAEDIPAEVTDQLPMGGRIRLGGKFYRTEWLGGISEEVVDAARPEEDADYFKDYRYGFAWGPDNPDYYYDLDEPKYIVAPANAVGTIVEFTDKLVGEDWRFYSATGLNYMYEEDEMTTNAELQQPPVIDQIGYYGYDPYYQHAVLCDMTETRRADGRYAIYTSDEGTELADDIAALPDDNAIDTIVMAIDGSGSFGSGSEAVDYVTEFIEAYHDNFPANNTELVLMKFSDYYEGIVDCAGYHVGTWVGIHDSIIDEATSGLLDHATGNGGDTNESQFEGIMRGMMIARHDPGQRAIVVYTDAASVVAWKLGGGRAIRHPRVWPPPIGARADRSARITGHH